MAANKFATMLHRNTHKITLILVYAVLEWVLIFLLLLNSLFSFLISKFASYFGLKPPCLWCSRVDHILDPTKRGGNSNSYRDLVCESHANEISKLGYCPNHRKLAEPRDLCKDCLSTQPNGGEKSIEISSRIAFFTWVSENRLETGENNSKCSCCDVRLSRKIYPSLLFFKPSWDALGCRAIKGDLEEEGGGGGGGGGGNNGVSQSFCREDELLNIMNLSTTRDIDRLVPIEMIDSSTIESRMSYINRKEEPLEKRNESSVSEPRIDNKRFQEAKCFLTGSEVLERFEICDLVNSSILMAEQLAVTEAAQTPCAGDNNAEAAAAMEKQGDETKSEIFTGMEVPEQIEAKDSTHSLPCALLDQHCVDGEEFGTSSGPHISAINNIELGEISDDQSMIFPDSKQTLNLSANSELCEPTYMDGRHHLHKKLQLLERRESGAEESWDGGSVISDTEAGDGALLTIEKLKSELRAHRQALSAVYAELEEERSAAAIAANHTMAMITRLQEEKSAMRTEALQYQRMMEEQSEYDQEALQLLNELMTKREKEKQELEKELEIYRKKVFDYESKESKTTMMMRRKDGSARSSRNSSTDELSVDLNCGFCENQEGSNNNTPIDTVLNLSALDESMEGFEEERLSILEELKALEEKLFTLADEDDEEQLFEDVKPIGNFEDIMDFKAKKLLPLFDATSIVNEEGDQLNEEGLESDLIRTQNSLVSKFEVVNKKLAIEVEVDHVYERLQALETDREFLKHCISSIKKGDKGMDLLQEILQHLRDLRSVELRARNMCDSPLL